MLAAYWTLRKEQDANNCNDVEALAALLGLYDGEAERAQPNDAAQP